MLFTDLILQMKLKQRHQVEFGGLLKKTPPLQGNSVFNLFHMLHNMLQWWGVKHLTGWVKDESGCRLNTQLRHNTAAMIDSKFKVLLELKMIITTSRSVTFSFAPLLHNSKCIYHNIKSLISNFVCSELNLLDCTLITQIPREEDLSCSSSSSCLPLLCFHQWNVSHADVLIKGLPAAQWTQSVSVVV